MNQYLSTMETAKRWNMSRRRVQILCNTGRVTGAVKRSGVWFIPSVTVKTQRIEGGKAEEKVLNVMSLFSGCGGMDLGFEGDFAVLTKSVNKKVHPDWKIKKVNKYWSKVNKTIFHTVFANDIKEEAKIAWSNYFCQKGMEESSYCLDSIVNLVKLQKENNINVFPLNVDIITGGFPCQDFSIAGKRLGFASDKGHDGNIIDAESPTNENRGHLYMWMREVISLVKPKMFIAENVKGLTNLKDTQMVIEKDFASICNGGYLIVPAKVLNAAYYGVPQGRERVIFFGFKKSALTKKAKEELSKDVISDQYNPYPVPTHYLKKNEMQSGKKHFVTVKDALVGLEEPDATEDPSQKKYSKAKYMGRHCQGQQEVNLKGIGPTIRSEHHGNIEFRRLSLEHGGKHKDELERGMVERRLTVRECARIQTFPDEYEFIISKKGGKESVSASEAYKIIGNAVPPLLAYHIAKRLEENWEVYFGEEND